MKILTVIQRYYPVIGGSEILTKNFMDYLAEKHKVTVYTTLAKDIQSFWYKNSKKISNSTELNYEIKRYDFLIPTQIKYDPKLNKLPLITNYPGPFSPDLWHDLVIKKINFDLIFSTSFPYDHILPAYVASKKWKIPIIIMPLIHQEFPELYLTGTKLTILNNSNAVLTISESEKNTLIKHGVDEKKLSVIKPILIPNSTPIVDPDRPILKKLKNFNGKIVLFIGLKSHMKGVFHLIDSMKLIWQKRDDLLLILIGPSSTKFEFFYSKLPKKYRDKIIDMGIVSDSEKNNVLSICDVFVLPSKSESFGLAFVEAWLHAKPVIGCDLPPVSEIIESNKNGILTEFGNVKNLAKSIIYLIDNPTICKKLGNEGKKKSSIFTSEENLKNFEEKCISVIDSFKHK